MNRADAHILLAAILLIAAVVRLEQLTEPYSIDEGATYVSFVTQSTWRILTDFGQGNNHPLCNLIARAGWLAGFDRWQLRGPTFLVSMLSLVAFYYFVAARFGLIAAAWPTWLLVVCRPQVVYAARLRGYGWLAAGTLVSSCLLLRALETGRARWWFAYAAAISLTTYAHLWGLCVLAGQMLAVAMLLGLRIVPPRRFGRMLAACTGAACCIALLYLPMLSAIAAMVGERRLNPILPELTYAVYRNFFICEVEPTIGLVALVYVLLVAGLVQLACGRAGGLDSVQAGGQAVGQPTAIGCWLIAIGLGPLLAGFAATLVFQPANFHARFLHFIVPCSALALAGVLGRIVMPGQAAELTGGPRPVPATHGCAGSGVVGKPAERDVEAGSAERQVRRLIGWTAVPATVLGTAAAAVCIIAGRSMVMSVSRAETFSVAFLFLWLAFGLGTAAVALRSLPPAVHRLCLWLIAVAGLLAGMDMLAGANWTGSSLRIAITGGTAVLAAWTAFAAK